MPKIDSVTGCTVMTLPEFWAGEAAQEGRGRSGGELMMEFYQEMDDSQRKQEEEMKEPAVALKMLAQTAKDWNDGDPDEGAVPEPESVIEVKMVRVGGGTNGSTTEIVARCRTKNGQTGEYALKSSYWVGSRMEPPEEDVLLTFTAEPT